MLKWLLSGFVILVFLFITSWPDGRLHVIGCDVGQGDGFLIVKGQIQVVIDGGPSEEGMLRCLERVPFWDRQIELVVSTHPDKDHVGGLPAVLERYKVQMVLSNGREGKGEAAGRLGTLLEGQKSYVPLKGETIRVGELVFRVLWPEDRESEGTNENSIVLGLTYGEFDALFTGDIASEQEALISTGEFELLKVAHHGSKNGSSSEFLDRVAPSVAMIGVGKNRYGHPTREVLERLEERGVSILRTDLNGEIEVISDGKRYWIKE